MTPYSWYHQGYADHLYLYQKLVQSNHVQVVLGSVSWEGGDRLAAGQTTRLPLEPD